MWCCTGDQHSTLPNVQDNILRQNQLRGLSVEHLHVFLDYRSTHIAYDHVCRNRRESSRNILQENKKIRDYFYSDAHLFLFISCHSDKVHPVVG